MLISSSADLYINFTYRLKGDLAICYALSSTGKAELCFLIILKSALFDITNVSIHAGKNISQRKAWFNCLLQKKSSQSEKDVIWSI